MDTLDVSLEDLEVKLAPGNAGGADVTTFAGYGSVFDVVDERADAIAPGAFRESLSDASRSGLWPVMLLNHGAAFGQDSTPIGLWTRLEEDSKGLRCEGRLAPTARGQEVAQLLKMRPRPAINGLSIGFFPVEWQPGSRSTTRRVLTKVRLIEISLVNCPVNRRALVDEVKASGDKRSFERQLRRLGLSHGEAKRLLASGWAGLVRDEHGEALRVLAGAMCERSAELQRIIKGFPNDDRYRGGG